MDKRTISWALILVGAAVLSFASALPAEATTTCTTAGQTGCVTGGTGFQFRVPNPLSCETGTNDPPILCVWRKLYNFIWAISFPIATIMILYAAWQMLSSAGDPKKFESGKKTLLYTVIGLALVLLATSLPLLIKDILVNDVGS